jgi:hypothetical protein
MIACMSQGSTLRAKTQFVPALFAGKGTSGQERGDRWIALLVFAAAILYLWPLRDFLSFNADEGVTLTMAERILQGQIPYRDFFTFVTPRLPSGGAVVQALAGLILISFLGFGLISILQQPDSYYLALRFRRTAGHRPG